MNWRDRLIARGVFDRLVNMYSQARNADGTYVQGEIGINHRPIRPAVLALMGSLNLPNRYAQDAFRALEEEARRAVNAARRFNVRPGDPQTRPLNQLPCPENPGGRCTERMEVTGWVEIVDPATGARQRVPFVLSSDSPLTRQQIAAEASRMARQDVTSRGYDAGGRIDPATATVGQVIIGSITGRG